MFIDPSEAAKHPSEHLQSEDEDGKLSPGEEAVIFAEQSTQDGARHLISRARTAFRMFVPHGDECTVAEFAQRLNKQNGNPDSLLPEVEAMVAHTFDIHQTGRVTLQDFTRIYKHYEVFRIGYRRGFDAGLAAGLQRAAFPGQEQTTDQRDLDFREFTRLLRRDTQFRHHLAYHTWATVLRPGLLKTPIHKTVELPSIEDFLAGTWSGVVTTLVGHPFDTIKVRMQMANVAGAPPALARVGESAPALLVRTLRTEGIAGLYRGIGTPMASVPLVNSIVFASYEHSKRVIAQFKGVEREDLSQDYLAVCGGISGLIACSVVSPVELVRSRMQVQTSQEATALRGRGRAVMRKGGQIGLTHYSSSWDCAWKTVQAEGVFGLMRGLVPTIVRDVPAYVTQFYVYEGLKLAVANQQGIEVKDLKARALLLSGGLGGMAGWIATYPFDIIKTRIQVAPKGTYPRHAFLPDGGLLSCWRQSVHELGYRGLFQGLSPCLARAFPVNGCAFVAYESASRFLTRNHERFAG